MDLVNNGAYYTYGVQDVGLVRTFTAAGGNQATIDGSY